MGPAIKADNLRSYVRTLKKTACLVRNDGNLGRGTATDDMVGVQSEPVCVAVVVQSGPVCVTA